jgi:mRNA degradation ribonuclease J1/J2
VNAPDLMLLISSRRNDHPQNLLDLLRDGYQGFNLRAGDQLYLPGSALAGLNTAEYFAEFAKRGVDVNYFPKLDLHSFKSENNDQAVLLNLLKPERIILFGSNEVVLRKAKKSITDKIELEQIILPQNGIVYELTNGKIHETKQVPAGLLRVEETQELTATERLVQAKRQLSHSGMAAIAIRLRSDDKISLRDLKVSLQAVSDNEQTPKLLNKLRAMLVDLVNDSAEANLDMEQLESKVVKATQQFWQAETGKVPAITVNILR